MSKDIAAALPIAAKMLAGRLDIDLRFGGSTAMTNGKIIYIPQLPLDSKRAKTLAFGYLVHENGHIRDTDFQVGARVAPLDDMENILEDIRIEKCAWRRYPGSRKTLSDLIDLLVAEEKMGKIPKPDRPINVLMAYMLYRLRATVLEQAVLEAPAVAAEALLRSLLPNELCDDITALMFEVRQTQSTLDVVVLARRILDMVMDASKQPQQPQQSQQSEEESEQQEDFEEEQSGQGGQGDSTEEDDSSQDDESNSGGSGSDASEENDAQQGDDGSSESEPDTDENDGSGDGDGDDTQEQDAGASSDGDPTDDLEANSSSESDGDSQGESSNEDGDADGQPDQGSGDNAADSDNAGSSSDEGEEEDAGTDGSGSSGNGGEDSASSEASDPGSAAGDMQSVEGASQSDASPEAGAATLTQEQLDAIASILADGASDVVTDLGDVIAEELNGMENVDDDGSHSETIFAEPVLAEGNPDALAEMMQSTRSATTALRYRMEQLMETQRRCKRRKSSSGRRINAAATWQLQAGYTRVFERSTDGQEVDTAVMLLLDRSGSMDHQIELASQATLSLAFSLSHVDGVDVAAAAFPAPGNNYPGGGYDYGRNVLELTRFGERVPATAARYAGLKVYGGTPLAEALLWAQHQLLMQRATRKILMVKTDGVPNDRNAALKVIRMGESAGIEIVGLGIGIDISPLIPESRMIASIDEMPRAVFSLMESKLALPLAA